MGVSITPKSVWRENDNVIVGFGEIPTAIYINEQGRKTNGWALPDGTFTDKRSVAVQSATRLNQIISFNNTSPDSLIILPEKRRKALLGKKGTNQLNTLLSKTIH